MPISILRIAAQLTCAAASLVPSASSTQKTASHCSEAGIAILASLPGTCVRASGGVKADASNPVPPHIGATYYSSRRGAKEDFPIMPFRPFAALALALVLAAPANAQTVYQKDPPGGVPTPTTAPFPTPSPVFLT